MDSIIKPVERLRSLPNAFVDVNFRQDREAFRKQLATRREAETISDDEVDSYVTHVQESIAELVEKVIPDVLPKEYLFFLEYYGGLEIWNENDFRFEIHGIGPMVLENYWDFIIHNWGERSDPLLPGPRGLIIAGLRLDLELTKAKAWGVKTETFTRHDETKIELVPSKRVEFRLDLAGIVEKGSIIGLGPDETDTPHPLSLGDGDLRRWQKLGGSFSEWLELVADTHGLLGYVY